jgi:DNA repair exonuclease SbcCD ATPase subunit
MTWEHLLEIEDKIEALDAHQADVADAIDMYEMMIEDQGTLGPAHYVDELEAERSRLQSLFDQLERDINALHEESQRVAEMMKAKV